MTNTRRALITTSTARQGPARPRQLPGLVNGGWYHNYSNYSAPTRVPNKKSLIQGTKCPT